MTKPTFTLGAFGAFFVLGSAPAPWWAVASAFGFLGATVWNRFVWRSAPAGG